ncbi:MAG: hypothetical protein GQ529_02860 [Methyloprofundus sp.]|nr:hypothetical protein [Methyloprofundus sp.]
MINGAVLLPQKAQHFPGMGVASIRFWVTVIFTLSILGYSYWCHRGARHLWS